MTERQKQLLQLITEYYIETAEPVGSQMLVESNILDVSGATVRNDMRALEEAGFLTHPHTSAGRVPTPMGYEFYSEHIMNKPEVHKELSDLCTDIASRADNEHHALKQSAKEIAEIANTAVIMSLGEQSVYYTGLSLLFAQPEFVDRSMSLNVSAMFDRCEQILPEIFEKVNEEPTIFIGKNNPLGDMCGTVVGKIGKRHADQKSTPDKIVI